MWEVHVGKSGYTEVSKTVKPLWIHSFSLEYFAVKVGMCSKVLQSIDSIHFFGEVLLSVPQPFQVLSFNLERESLMLINRSILNFIQLVKLPLENHEVSTSLSIKIDDVLLEFFKGVNDLKEVLVCQKEPVISGFDFVNDFFNRV